MIGQSLFTGGVLMITSRLWENNVWLLSIHVAFLPLQYWTIGNSESLLMHSTSVLFDCTSNCKSWLHWQLPCTVAWWFSDSVCNWLPLCGCCPHQIKHLNNYCLICCGGRRACGLIMTRLERGREPSPTHSSLLIASPPGPQVTLTTLQSLQRQTNW